MPLYAVDVLNTKLYANDTEDAKTLKAVSQTNLPTYLSSQEIKEYVSPGGHMIVDFVPLKAVHSNIRNMTGPQEYTSIFSDIRKEMPNVVACCHLVQYIKSSDHRSSVF